MNKNIDVTHGGYVTDESYIYDCDYCEHTMDRENTFYDENSQKKACICCKERLPDEAK